MGFYIFLQPGATLINVDPYRYPHFQKNEIKRLTTTMLQQGLVRPSINPFSSLVLLGQKEGWVNVTFLRHL